MKASVIEKQRILVVDDDSVIRRIVRNALEENGYAVLSAANGKEGVKIAKSALPDLILLDIMLPDLDGHQVCKKLRSMGPTSQTSVIMITAADQPAEVVRGFDDGADDYINPSYDLACYNRLRLQATTNKTIFNSKPHAVIA